MEKKKYQKIYHLVSEYAHFYNYDYSWNVDTMLADSKFFAIDSLKDNFQAKITFLTSVGVNKEIYTEHVSLVINLLKELGLDPTAYIDEKIAIQDYLDYLDVDYEIVNDNKDYTCRYTNENNELGYTKQDDNKIITVIDIKKLINELDDIVEDNLDVAIIACSNEEKLKASILLNDLRLSCVTCDINYQNLEKDEQLDYFASARNLIILDDEDLKKGLIKVRDNLIQEEVEVPEDEIIDYILGVI